MLRNLIVSDIEAGEGVGVIDPHGDLAEELLDMIPPWRSRDVVYFNPADLEYPVAMNLLRSGSRDEIPLVASAIVSAFKTIWRDSWGPRLEYILYACIMALAECQNATILGVQRMLSDEIYRSWVLKQVTDPAVRAFWLVEFAGYDRRLVAEATAPVQNKIGALLLSPAIRRIVGQVRSSIDLRFVMDRRRIFIANLSKGKVGEDKANLLGSLLIAQFQQAALSRANVPEPNRVNFSLFVDEYSNFVTDSFASVLAEARKYHFHLVLSGQHLGQTADVIRDAVFGNVGNVISFRIGEADAPILQREFDGVFPSSRFTELANHEILVKRLEEGRYREPFHATTLPPQGRFYGRRDKLIRQSRQRYATPRALVENRIRRWMAPD